MKHYRIVVAPSFIETLAECRDYIAERSPQNAERWEARVVASLSKIAELPGYAIDFDMSEKMKMTVRRFVFERTYLIYFNVNEDTQTVRFINFRHGARQPPGEG